MVGRVIRVIEHLARSDDGPTLTDLTRSTGLPKSTMHRLLGLLTAHGAVTRHGNRYRLGDQLVELIPLQGTRSTARLRKLLMPYLTELHRHTGLIVRLGIPVLPDVVFVETVYGHRHHTTAWKLPDRAPAHRCAAGKLLLALGPEPEPPSDPPVDGATNRALRDLGPMEHELARIRAHGIAISRGDHVRGLHTLAAPVTTVDGSPVAVLVVCGPGPFPERGLAMMRRLCQAASAATATVRGASRRPLQDLSAHC